MHTRPVTALGRTRSSAASGRSKLLVATVGGFALLVVFGNVTDYDTKLPVR